MGIEGAKGGEEKRRSQGITKRTIMMGDENRKRIGRDNQEDGKREREVGENGETERDEERECACVCVRVSE